MCGCFRQEAWRDCIGVYFMAGRLSDRRAWEGGGKFLPVVRGCGFVDA